MAGVKRFTMLVRPFFAMHYVYPQVLYPMISGLVLGWLSLTLRSGVLAGVSLFGSSIALASAFRLRQESSYLNRDFPPQNAAIVLNIRAPLVSVARRSVPCVGDREVGEPFAVALIVQNIGRSSARGVTVRVEAQPDLCTARPDHVEGFDLEPGEVRSFQFSIIPVAKTAKPHKIRFAVGHGSDRVSRILLVSSQFDAREHPPVGCEVRKWRHGLLCAACWRGDIDGFDNLSNQATLQPALDIAGLLRVPPTLFISGRLSLDFDEWSAWINEFPDKMEGDVSYERFNSWLLFLRSIKAENDLEYPLLGCGWPCAQIGNHMYYHYWSPYGYDASRDTGWESNVEPGRFMHSWEKSRAAGRDILAELTDNVQINATKLKEFFGVQVTTWSAPGNRPHSLYPKALSQAGVLGASESVQRRARVGRSWAPYRPDLGECMPYHPAGSAVVETGAHTRRFDPFTVTHLVCLKKAVRRALSKRSQVTYLWHPHMRLYSPFFGGASSVSHFQEFLRFLVQDMGSTCWLTTHHNIVKYWESVLCPQHKAIHVTMDGRCIRIENTSSEMISGVPFDVTYRGGKRSCFVIDMSPFSCRVLGG